jgi:hypothetical protein
VGEVTRAVATPWWVTLKPGDGPIERKQTMSNEVQDEPQTGMVMNGQLVADQLLEHLPVWLRDDVKQRIVENVLDGLQESGAVLFQPSDELIGRFIGDEQLEAISAAMTALVVAADARQKELSSVMRSIAEATEIADEQLLREFPINSDEPCVFPPRRLKGTTPDGQPHSFRTEEGPDIGVLYVHEGTEQRYTWRQLNWEKDSWPPGPMKLREVLE